LLLGHLWVFNFDTFPNTLSQIKSFYFLGTHFISAASTSSFRWLLVGVHRRVPVWTSKFNIFLFPPIFYLRWCTVLRQSSTLWYVIFAFSPPNTLFHSPPCSLYSFVNLSINIYVQCNIKQIINMFNFDVFQFSPNTIFDRSFLFFN
jgi:hypothetical protein